MPPVTRKSPLEHPLEISSLKHYAALVADDGLVFPIEERLGRRLLRTIDPDSREARDLLASGQVRLVTPRGETVKGSTRPLGGKAKIGLSSALRSTARRPARSRTRSRDH